MLVLLRPPLAILALVTALAGCAAIAAPSHPSAARSPIGAGASHVAQQGPGAVSPDITPGVLKLTLRPHGWPLRATFIPAVVSATGQPVPLHGARARRAARSYASLRGCTGLSARPSS